MHAVGVRFATNKNLCSGKDTCMNQNINMEPGVVYEAIVKTTEEINPNMVMANMYKVIQEVRKKYPGVIINYIEVSDDRRTIILQMFDTPGWQLIAVLALILGIIIGLYKLANITINFLEEYIPKPPGGGGEGGVEGSRFWSAVEAMMWGVAIALPVGAVAKVISSIKKK